MAFNLADLFESVADAIGDRVALVCGDRHLTYRQLDERADRLAQAFTDAGIIRGDFIGVQLPNGSEYLETMLAAFKIRAVPVNINYRYVPNELRYLYRDAGLVALVHHHDATNAVNQARDVMAEARLVLVVGDDDDTYEQALAGAAPITRSGPRSADDWYCVYTGGTTGMPKGVIWRHEDIFFSAMGGGDPFQFGNHITRPEQLVEVLPESGLIALAIPPFMHAAGHWLAFSTLFGGGTVVTLEGGAFDAATAWRLVEAERVNVVVVVGNAMAGPLANELDANPTRYDLSSLMALGSGGALLSASIKARLRAHLPELIIKDAFGSSETGQLGGRAPVDDPNGPPRLQVDDHTAVFNDEHRRVRPGSGEVGLLAKGGRVPLRYLGDPEKTAATFIEVDGKRWALPGDLATVEADGTIVVLGRSSACINTGGEKVYPEEVEAILAADATIADVIVVGAPDETWGQLVCAVVQANSGAELSLESVQAIAAAHLAGYKMPRRLVVVDEIDRLPSGKPNRVWAAQLVTRATGSTLESPSEHAS